ncbi:MAG TPA: LysR family transcriptional regulator ArgP [Noviherbaspirillum sp.]|jgi:LysR family transcriptional regulator (chromosome initiation inhibitor)|uniref:LysR family transcriptional regulator ArgP n=1 Tax=Noviherbaspirillum sp. TaxID=1926288 RepID=UPI002DDCB39F|nr:LysR family transcriptional regulator ArgP [Noviherbaspirillum sp.]HEV2612204.1 LysR family transcriptional regulator ArgP [Noviherbaspirillum sp.]
MQLDSRQCEAVLAVLDSGSFEQAALRLHLTPSAVSQRVRALEESLGTPLVVRGRPCRSTPKGQRLLQYLRRVRLLEEDLQAELASDLGAPLTIAVAVNADSLGSWFLPALAGFLIREQVLLDVTVDDQDHTHALLEAGLALGCISTEPHAMRGCVAAPLGNMRYRCMASPDFRERWFGRGMRREAVRRAPVMVFNRKDKLQSDFVLRHFGLPPDAYPCHYLPASEPYLQAIVLGLGWGMLPEVQARTLMSTGALVDLAPSRSVDVALYWHSWKVQSPRLERLSETLVDAARRVFA